MKLKLLAMIGAATLTITTVSAQTLPADKETLFTNVRVFDGKSAKLSSRNRAQVTNAGKATNERETIARFTKDDSWPNILLSLPPLHLDAQSHSSLHKPLPKPIRFTPEHSAMSRYRVMTPSLISPLESRLKAAQPIGLATRVQNIFSPMQLILQSSRPIRQPTPPNLAATARGPLAKATPRQPILPYGKL